MVIRYNRHGGTDVYRLNDRRGATNLAHPRNVTQQVNAGAAYTEDEVEFMLALHRYKTENQRPAPTWAEVLAVAKALGYRKVNEGESPGP